MKNDDYGFYGKGTSGYVHYKQPFDESQKSKSEAGSAHHPKKSEPKIPLSKDGYIAMAIYYAPFLLGIIAIVVILHLMGA